MYYVLFIHVYLNWVIPSEKWKFNEKLRNMIILLIILQSLEQGHLGI